MPLLAKASNSWFLLLFLFIASSAYASSEVLANFVYPLMSPRVSSAYGQRIHPIRRFSHKHSGVDLAAPQGTPIRAVATGRVVFSDPYAGYGKLIVLQHSKNTTTHYAHCFEIKVKPGQIVQAGQIIGTVGATGTATGPHLHLEVRINGVPHDPERFFPQLAGKAAG